MQFAPFRDFAISRNSDINGHVDCHYQINPKLTSDYFSITKIFSTREGEDGQSSSRITSSINILFYAYCSLMLGYFLMIIFHYVPSQYAISGTFSGKYILGRGGSVAGIEPDSIGFVFFENHAGVYVFLLYLVCLRSEGFIFSIGLDFFWEFSEYLQWCYSFILSAMVRANFLCYYPENDVLGIGGLDDSDNFQTVPAGWSFDVSFIFVHLCDRINTLSYYNQGTLLLA